MKKMNVLIAICAVMITAGCGYESRDSDLTGQVKRVVHQTPLICPERFDADLSLGVLKGGQGSMSTQDVWVTIPNATLVDKLKAASASGDIVTIKYDVLRWVWCQHDHVVTSVEVSK